MTTPISALIVDDEPLARARVRRLLTRRGGFEVLGEAGDGQTAIADIAARRPDVVLLDIQMPGIDGLGVAGAVSRQSAPVIVFVTAFDRFAAHAFDLDAADYLLKPYDEDRFAAMCDRVRRRLGHDVSPEAATIEHLLAISAGQVRLLPVTMIERIEGAGNYAEVTMAGGADYLVRETLAALADKLPTPFLRIHRSAIVRTDRIVALTPIGHGDAVIALADGGTATVSRRYRAALAARLRTP